ncbi:MAG: pyridoxamine 5'-phosphate oxidase family protein [Ilumatobacter sp.]|uniref:pyridoxamine 5'-phosphate oxidase family protein n=1 Tax=Ilumatobacter sp. TaxID=1967498 RepID=UPI002616C299|nr:pyridoxamine 5'-phosphate oxidase family protein [Ilumatobacter sp.]MDJ0770967.1 pyridoxamine 5'-phosphate oxidase family protein [Ilumatobacter sp.]
MSLQLASASVWKQIERNNFAVLGMVTARHQARTVGIVYVVDDHRLYIGAGRDQWKTKHIAQNGDVSMTIPIAKRVPLVPWVKIPAATITFSGTARVLEKDELGEALFERLYRHDAERGGWCAIEVTPQRHFITYGIGVSLWAMRSPDRSRARVPVESDRGSAPVV